jgi:hypothetical protein
MPKLTDDELGTLIDAEFDSAMGAEGGTIASERALAWDYYLSKPLGNEIEGESDVVTSDVSDIIDGALTSLLKIFTTEDNLVSFDPVGPEDIDAAEQESDYVNYVFFKQNPAFLILYTWFFDALVQKNGIVKAWWDESEQVTTERYCGLTLEEAEPLLNDPELEALEREEYTKPALDPAGNPIINPMTLQPLEITYHDIKFRRTAKVGRVRVENVPPEEYRISSDARSLDPTKARMVGQERLVKRSELVAMGFDQAVVDSLPAHGQSNNSPEDQARRDLADDITGSPLDHSQEEVLVREGFIRADRDGDGKAELLQVFRAGNKNLEIEDADRSPFHVISPQPLPHKHFGLATAEKVMDVQEVNSTLVRQILMNLYHTNNPEKAVWEQAIGENTLDDLLTTRVGKINRFTRPVGESFAAMTVPFTAGATFPMLEFWDKVKRDRTGISSDSQGLSPDALKNIQQTVLASSIDQSKMKVEAIARVFAETGIKSMFLHIHELNRKHQQKEQIVRLRNEFVPVDPRSWRTRYDMTVNIGLGIGTREQNLLHLNAIAQRQREAFELQMGNLVITPQNWYRVSAEMVKNANLKDPALYFSDPGQQMAPPPNQEQLKLQQQQQALAAQEQQIEQRRQQLDAQKAQLERQQMALEHQREMAELKRKVEADKDRFAVENEKLRNDLLEIRLKYQQPAAQPAAE